jgi:hypothetical protein
VAAGALLVAGTFAAGALGLSSATAPFLGEQAPEHAPALPGSDRDEIGGPAVAAPPERDQAEREDATRSDRSVAGLAENGAPATPVSDQGYQPPTLGQGSGTVGGGGGTGAGGGGTGGGGQVEVPAPAPAPAPVPDPPTQPEWEPQRGTLEKVITPVTDTVGDIVEPVTDTVGDVLEPVTDTVSGVLSPVTGVLSGGDQPALTMINPLGDLLGR